jgi:hypothetical protein
MLTPEDCGHGDRPSMMRRAAVLLAVLAMAATLVACTSAPTGTSETGAAVDAISAPLLAANGQVPTGPTSGQPITVGDPAEHPWLLYLEASRAVGLDFAGLVGRSGELRVTPIRGAAPDAAAYVLVVDGVAVGAWVGPGGSSSGVLPISQRP